MVVSLCFASKDYSENLQGKRIVTIVKILTSIMDESELSDKEHEVILELQSSDVESSTDDEFASSANKRSPYSSPDSVPVWKALVNIVNFIEGIGFLALPYAVRKGGIVVIVAFLIIPVCLWHTGKVLTECLYDTDEKQRRERVRSTFKELGEILLPKYGGYIITA